MTDRLARSDAGDPPPAADTETVAWLLASTEPAVAHLTRRDLIHPSFRTLHWPPYWHYDVLQALVMLTRMGRTGNPRCQDGIELLQERRGSDDRWRAGKRWWSPPGGKTTPEVVDWSRDDIDDQMVTLRALTVLHAR